MRRTSRQGVEVGVRGRRSGQADKGDGVELSRTGGDGASLCEALGLGLRVVALRLLLD